MLQQIARDFLMLLVTVDPIGTVALFVPLTAAMSEGEKRKTAWRAVLISAGVLLGFLIAGQVLLSHLGVRLVSFQLAGGIILFLFGLQMVFGTGVASEGAAAEPGHDIAVFPLAMPAIANPGAIMAVVLLTDNHRQSIAEQGLTALVLLVVLALTLLALLASNRIHRLLGATGANVLIRVMGLLLAALATEQVVAGVEALMRGLR
jgi:multiple antibiotic resistance protein